MKIPEALLPNSNVTLMYILKTLIQYILFALNKEFCRNKEFIYGGKVEKQ